MKTALLNDPDVGGLRIDVDTFKGVVTLSGSVKTKRGDKAIALARKVGGVKDVKSTLQDTAQERRRVTILPSDSRLPPPSCREDPRDFDDHRRPDRRRSRAWGSYERRERVTSDPASLAAPAQRRFTGQPSARDHRRACQAPQLGSTRSPAASGAVEQPHLRPAPARSSACRIIDRNGAMPVPPAMNRNRRSDGRSGRRTSRTVPRQPIVHRVASRPKCAPDRRRVHLHQELERRLAVSSGAEAIE